MPHLKGFVKKEEVWEKLLLFLARRNDEITPNITCNRERFEKFQRQSSPYKLPQGTQEGWLLLVILPFYHRHLGKWAHQKTSSSSDGIQLLMWASLWAQLLTWPERHLQHTILGVQLVCLAPTNTQKDHLHAFKWMRFFFVIIFKNTHIKQNYTKPEGNKSAELIVTLIGKRGRLNWLSPWLAARHVLTDANWLWFPWSQDSSKLVYVLD